MSWLRRLLRGLLRGRPMRGWEPLERTKASSLGDAIRRGDYLRVSYAKVVGPPRLPKS